MTKIYIRRKIDPTKSLLVIAPEVSSEWHPTKNGDLTPNKVSYGSREKVWWKCSKGHSWDAIVVNRTKGRGCPLCRYSKKSKEI